MVASDAMLRIGQRRKDRSALLLATAGYTHHTPVVVVRLACDLCPRRGQYRKETLIAQFGADVLMPGVRHLIAQCPRKDAAACGFYWRVSVSEHVSRDRSLSSLHSIRERVSALDRATER
jgi:hypothetical protein